MRTRKRVKKLIILQDGLPIFTKDVYKDGFGETTKDVLFGGLLSAITTFSSALDSCERITEFKLGSDVFYIFADDSLTVVFQGGSPKHLRRTWLDIKTFYETSCNSMENFKNRIIMSAELKQYFGEELVNILSNRGIKTQKVRNLKRRWRKASNEERIILEKEVLARSKESKQKRDLNIVIVER